MGTHNDAWYFDVAAGEVTQGKKRGWGNRMGPYDSREAAQRALETAAQRTADADAADEAEAEGNGALSSTPAHGPVGNGD